MTLSVFATYGDRLAGAYDIVGMSNLVTFLEHTEAYRRDLRRVKYGDERDPAIRKFMEDTAPLNNTAKMTKPLFIVAGRNDPRVPYTEGEQLIAKSAPTAATSGTCSPTTRATASAKNPTATPSAPRKRCGSARCSALELHSKEGQGSALDPLGP